VHERSAIFHVIMMVKTTAPATSGNQPPWAIFSEFAVKKTNSIDPKAGTSGHPKRAPIPKPRAAKKKIAVVASIVSVTAIP
jgi:hypothetical protein